MVSTMEALKGEGGTIDNPTVLARIISTLLGLDHETRLQETGTLMCWVAGEQIAARMEASAS